MYVFQTDQILPISINEAWDFFSNPKNLAIITPPELCFRILTKMDNQEIFEGMRINYSLKPLFGIETHWQTVIGYVDKPNQFTDKQEKGPYRRWEHTHIFKPHGLGTSMYDRVTYQLPFGWVGLLLNRVIVRRKIERIFDYRRAALDQMFVQSR